MANFRIWGTITQKAPSAFCVAVSAVPAEFPAPEGSTTLRTADASSRQEAEQLQERMMIELGAEVRGRGDRVVDVEN